MRTRWLDLALVAIIVLGASGHADADPEIDKAEQLFAEGRALLSSNLLQACSKFVESLRINPAAIGTLFNVALCDEKLGKIASATEAFTLVRDRSREQDLAEYARAAEEHLAVLEPDVPHLTIRLIEPLAGIKVLVDDRVVPFDKLGDITLDPGERVIVVSAPDRLPFRLPLTIARAQRRTVVIPTLERSVTVTSSHLRIGQLVTAGGGAVFLAGVGLGLYARHLYAKEFDSGECMHVSGNAMCSPAGTAAINNARNWGLGGTLVGISGIAIAAVGAYLWYSAPRGTATEPDKLSLVPDLAADHLGLAAFGRF